ncbi:hypothetical protein Bbelb_281050 [Branchiostoma belcheri]|nr:hypothetical protein Bbelb_281050 [Branchiostoma belcheri]
MCSSHTSTNPIKSTIGHSENGSQVSFGSAVDTFGPCVSPRAVLAAVTAAAARGPAPGPAAATAGGATAGAGLARPPAPAVGAAAGPAAAGPAATLHAAGLAPGANRAPGQGLQRSAHVPRHVDAVPYASGPPQHIKRRSVSA